jgi:hypothetical protein
MFALKPVGRSCDGCTMCCQGWLSGDAWGHKFYRGKPCGWLGSSGCSVYEARPYNPCVTFQCTWKSNLALPEWLKPDRSGVIVIPAWTDELYYLRVIQSNRPVEQRIHDWAQQHSDKTGVSIVVPVDLASVRVYTKDSKFRTAIDQIFTVVE